MEYFISLAVSACATVLSGMALYFLKRYFKEKVYLTAIPRNVRLSEAPSHGMPVIAYDRLSRGAVAYSAVAEEFLKRGGN